MQARPLYLRGLTDYHADRAGHQVPFDADALPMTPAEVVEWSAGYDAARQWDVPHDITE